MMCHPFRAVRGQNDFKRVAVIRINYNFLRFNASLSFAKL